MRSSLSGAYALAAGAALAGLVSAVAPARAALWPDAPDRVKAELLSKDVGRRRAAAADLDRVPRKDAVPLLKIALVDPDVEVRLAAAEVAARTKVRGLEEEISSLLLPWLTDAEPRLREGALLFFAKLPDARLVKVIARSLGDTDPRVRLAAVRALGASGSSDAVAPLLARLDDSNSKVRLSVARALARLGDKRAVTPLVSKVQDEASEVRQAVVRTLGELGDPKASPALVIALRDSALEVKLEALSALSRLRAADAVASIAPLASDPSKKAGAAELRRAALAALGRIGTDAAVSAIVATFGQHEDDKAGVSPSPAREAAVAAGAPAVPTLVAALEVGQDGAAASSGASRSASSAAWALGEIGDPSAGPAIVKAMRRGTVPLALALHALASLGDPTHLPVALEHVASPDRVVRAQALVATARLLDPDKPDGRAVEPLLASLDLAQTAEDRAEIAVLLGRTGAARVADVLVGLTAAKDDRLRLAAIDALGTLGAPSAGPALLKLVDDPSAPVRLRAAIALGRAGGADVLGPTLTRLGGASVDRLAVVLAASGLLERHGDAASVERAGALAATLGAERDLLLVGVGRAKAGPAVPTLVSALATHASDVEGRRAIAVALGARGADPAAIAPLVALAKDPDASVRAQVAWSLGAIGGPSEVAVVTKLLDDAAPPVAANAAAAIGRILEREARKAPSKEVAAPKTLCLALDDERPYVRANALWAIRVVERAGRAASCDEARIRAILGADPNEVVRSSAARALALRASAKDEAAAKARSALERCTSSDPSGAVASVCREALAGAPSSAPGTPSSLVIFVAPDDGSTPLPGGPYAIERPDGSIHVGTADRRGAVVELGLGEGPVRLRVPVPANGVAVD